MDTELLLWTAAGGGVIPFLTALITKWNAHAGVKAVVTLLLAGLTGVLSEAAAPGGYDWAHGGLYAVEGFAVAVAAHFGLWKPAAVTGSQGAIARTVPGGIGPAER